jgi:hypothetical protein
MRPPRPLPTAPPFLTLYTPTFRRPRQLSACLASIGAQTAVEDLQQIVHPDHVGYGVGPGLFGRLQEIAPSVRGRYVNFLCDDDTLASERCVELVKAFAEARGNPDVIVCKVVKGALTLPLCDPEGEPVCGQCDLTSFIVRRDVWFAHLSDYQQIYEGDYHHAHAMWRAGRKFAFCNLVWAIGGASNGRPEY